MQVTDEMVRVARSAYMSDIHHDMDAAIRAMLTAALAAMWQDSVVVPREPTTVQANAGVACDDLRTGYETVKHIYRHMVAASPYMPLPSPPTREA